MINPMQNNSMPTRRIMPPANQRGFTLIELVVVIVVLGVLAAFAVPRFMGLDTQARISSVNSLAGTLRSASAMAHSVYLARGNVSPITIDGQSITFTNGYPDANSIGSLLAPGTVTANTQAGAFTQTVAGTTATFALNGASTPAQCAATYQAAAAANASPTIAVVPAGLGGGGATQVTGGC
jgi:MSHA pilin protein MshA